MNHLEISGVLLERGALRYTPAGIPIVEGLLQHQSTQIEAGQPRQVECAVKFLAAGPLAVQLNLCELSCQMQLSGFLARKNRNSKTLIFHLQNLCVDLTEIVRSSD